jgi:hypothetical protein
MAFSTAVMLIGIDHIDRELHYRYEYVPHNLTSYLKFLKNNMSPSEYESVSKSFVKSLSSKLTGLIS